jgi:hypothetical protein
MTSGSIFKPASLGSKAPDTVPEPKRINLVHIMIDKRKKKTTYRQRSRRPNEVSIG